MARPKLKDWIEKDNLTILKGWARDGMTDKEIAKAIGISRSSFYNWIKKSNEFEEAIKDGRRPLNVEVEDAFIKECKGYYVNEVTTITHPDGTTSRKITQKYIRPNTNAIIHYLKLRDPDRWMDSNIGDNSTIEKVDELLHGIDLMAFNNLD